MTGARHTWEKVHDHRKRCERCRLLADRRPHPYGRQWWTEWSAEDGRTWNTLQGDKTPPCPPPSVEQPEASSSEGETA